MDQCVHTPSAGGQMSLISHAPRHASASLWPAWHNGILNTCPADAYADEKHHLCVQMGMATGRCKFKRMLATYHSIIKFQHVLDEGSNVYPVWHHCWCKFGHVWLRHLLWYLRMSGHHRNSVVVRAGAYWQGTQTQVVQATGSYIKERMKGASHQTLSAGTWRRASLSCSPCASQTGT